MSVLEELYNLVKTLNMNDENEEKCYGVPTDFIRKLTDLFFITIGEKASTNIHLRKMYRFKKECNTDTSILPMYVDLDDYPPYSDRTSVIFETQINRNLICIHVYTICVAHNYLITWLSKHSWEMLLSEFSQAEKLSPCTRTIICNNCEQNNLLGDILNAGDNVYYQTDYGFTGSFFKISPTVINDYTKKK